MLQRDLRGGGGAETGCALAVLTRGSGIVEEVEEAKVGGLSIRNTSSRSKRSLKAGSASSAASTKSRSFREALRAARLSFLQRGDGMGF